MKRLLATFLALSLSLLSVEPALAGAAKTFNAPLGAPITVNATAKGLNADLPVLPAVNIPAMPNVAVTPAIVPQGATPVIQKLAIETAPDAKAPEAALNAAYNGQGAQQLNASSPVNGGGNGTGSNGAPNLSPSTSNSNTPKTKASGSRRSFSGQRGSANFKVIGIIAGVVLTIAIIVAVFVHRGNQKDKLWNNSPAAAEVVQVEKARRASDAETLFKISADAKKRAAEMREKIADAKSRRSDKVGELSMKDAEAMLAFDELAATRAELNANEVSQDEARRVGGKRPETWNGKIAELDAEAKSTGFEGKVGNELDALKAEVHGENGARQKFDEALDHFESQVPGLGGGALKEQREKARQDLGGFDKEISAEQGAHDKELSIVRGRISDRLSQGNAQFREYIARHNALNKLARGAATTAAERASALDNELRTVADKIKLRDDLRKDARVLADEAVRLDADAKKAERTEVKEQAKDAQGNPMTDAQGNPVYTIRYEDRSGPIKQQAADKRKLAADRREDARRASDDARNAAVRAGAARDELNRQTSLMRDDETMQKEKLEGKIPASVPNVAVYNGWTWVRLDLQDSDFFYGTLTYDQANELRAKFAGVKGAVDETKKAIEGSRDEQNRKIQQQIDEELTRQKKSGF